MKRFRFTIFRLLVVVALCAVAVNCFLPPRVSFGHPEFTAFPPLESHWGGRPTMVIVRIPVTNDGIFPVWFKQATPRSYAAGGLSSTTEILSNSGLVMEWRSLSRGQVVELREYNLGQFDEIGIPLRDWAGREFLVTCEQVAVEPVWLNRGSLPLEVPDPPLPAAVNAE